MTTAFRLRPIDPDAADALRRTATVRRVADAHPGYPCRQCLRDAAVGDELVLVSHDPFVVDSPYRTASPIFLHADPCAPPAHLDELPTQLTRRRLSVRAFDGQAMMVGAEVVEGEDLDDSITAMFSDATVDHLHVHNASPGCWAVRVDRA